MSSYSSDKINSLPLNPNNVPSVQDLRVMETMFGNSNNNSSSYSYSGLIVPGILFFVLSLPFVDKFLKTKISASEFILLVIKTGLFLLLLLFFKLFGWA